MFFSDDFPHKPRSWPFFYGYIIAISSTIGIVFSAPGQTIGVSVFTDYLIDALKVSRFQLSNAYMVGTICSSLIIGRTGILLDKIGTRKIATIAALLLGIVLLGMSQIDRLAFYIGPCFPDRFGTVITLVVVTFGFLCMRYLGQGVMTLASRTMLMKWFVHLRGRINSIVGVFVTLMFSGAPLGFETLIRHFGWRGAWQLMAGVTGVGISVIIYLFFRNSPENSGLRPDGVRCDSTQKNDTGSEEVDWTLKEARKTMTFWVFNIGLSMFSLIITAITFHIVSIFDVDGHDRAKAVAIFLPGAIIGVVVNLGAGWLSDWKPFRFRLHMLLVALLSGLLLVCAGAMNLSYTWGILMLIAGNGIASGLFGTLSAVSWPRYFGRKHLGAISGYNMSYLVFFSAIGPSIFGFSFSKTGSYNIALICCFIISFLILLASIRAVQPIKSGQVLTIAENN